MHDEQFVHVLSAAVARLVEELSSGLGLAAPFTAVTLRDAIASWRGYQIDLIPFPVGAEKIYGLCVCKRPGYYAVFYRSDATLVQQQRILYHELGHIILSHVSPLKPVHVRRDWLTVTVQEQEAEMFAEAMTRYGLVARGTQQDVPSKNTPDRFTTWLTMVGG